MNISSKINYFRERKKEKIRKFIAIMKTYIHVYCEFQCKRYGSTNTNLTLTNYKINIKF